MKISRILNIFLLGWFVFAFGGKLSAQSYFQPFPNEDILTWDTSPYESYQYQGILFRIMYPNNYDSAATEKYPLTLFFHGFGETGEDNEKQLAWGGQHFRDQVLAGEFNGIVLFPQIESGAIWSPTWLTRTKNLLDKLIEDYNADPNRIYIQGLSSGGNGTWEFLRTYPKMVAAATPYAAAKRRYVDDYLPDSVPYIHIPMWYAQGGRDRTADALPWNANYLVEQIRAQGGNIRYLYTPNGPHNVWDRTYKKEDYFPFLLSHSKLSILVYGGQTSFCPGESFSVKLGITDGFDGYEWAKDNTGNIVSSGSNTITVTEAGDYFVRFARGTDWTDWSDPVTLDNNRQPSAQISISSDGRSVNLPALDGSNSVELIAPAGEDYYQWNRDGIELEGFNINSYTAAASGAYTTSVRANGGPEYFTAYEDDYFGNGPPEVPVEYRPETDGCLSNPSDPIVVTTENGLGRPLKPKNFFVNTLSESEIIINWDDVSDNELNFEIYRAEQAGGPYSIIAMIESDADPNPQEFLDSNLADNQEYFYRMRAVNQFGGSSYTDEKSASTIIDSEPPSAPILNLVATNTTYVDLAWSSSLDNVAVEGYDVYLDDVFYANTSDESIRVLGLIPENLYNFYVIAKDVAGNESIRSNQITAASIVSGLTYSYYHGSWSNLPDFDQLTPVKTGLINNFLLSPKTRNDNFGFKFEGAIRIETTGTYTFYTTSDDGSKLFINGQEIVDNDGLHGDEEQSGSISLSSGVHDIEVIFFERGGGETLEVRWQGPGISKQLIPDNVLTSEFSFPSLPNAPTDFNAIAVSYDQIDLSWTDNSSDELGFEITRSLASAGPYNLIHVTGPNEVSYSDQNLDPSTTYYYKVVSFNNNGISEGIEPPYLARLLLNNDYNDASGNGINTSPVNGPNFDSSIKWEGSHSIKFDGNNDYLNFDTNDEFIHNSFSERTFAMWIRAEDVSTNRVIFDEGGSTHGIGLRLLSGEIQAGVQSNNNRSNIGSSFPLDTWKHVAVVFDNGKLELFIDGVSAAVNNNVGYSTVPGHGNNAGIGATNSSNAFDSNGSPFDGWIDDFSIFNIALSNAEIQYLYQPFNSSNATTLSPPAIPNAPTNLVANAISSNQINLSWDDNSLDENGFEIYRTTSSLDQNWTLISTTGPNTGSNGAFSDTDLPGNATLYYKIRAVNFGGPSAYSNVTNSTTFNNAPILDVIIDRSVKFGTSLQLDVTATDTDDDPLTYEVTGLPTFGQFVDNGNGTGTFTFNPVEADTGNYSINVEVQDNLLASDDQDYSLTVNDNDNPVVDPIAAVNIEEGFVTNFSVQANDAQGNASITLSLENNPSFVTLSDLGNGSGEITVSTPIGSTGVVENISVVADDGTGGIGIETFDITILPTKINYEVRINFNNQSIYADLPWNNAGIYNQNRIISDLIDTDDQNRGQSLEKWENGGQMWDFYARSALGGGEQGIYETEVVETHYAVRDDANDPVIMKITGLNPSLTYDFTFFGRRVSGQSNDTRYKIDQQEVVLAALSNLNNVATILGVVPNVDGIIEIEVGEAFASGNDAGVISAMIYESYFLDGNPPNAPSALIVDSVSNNFVTLNWQDNANNESSFQVLRSTNPAGPYDNIATIDKNSIQYTDNTVAGSTSYYYKVVAINSSGNAESNVLNVTTSNSPPQIASIGSIASQSGFTKVISISASDEEGHFITLDASNLPPFVSFVDNGNGNGTLSITADFGDIGSYNGLRINAQDNFGASSFEDLVLTVVNDEFDKSIYINFNNSSPAGKPWNNVDSAPSNGTTYSDFYSSDDISETISVTAVSGWNGEQNTGYLTNNNSGIYEDSVLKTYWYTNNSATLRLNNLDPSKLYNLIFLASESTESDYTTEFTVSGNTVSLNGSKNSSEVASISGLVSQPDGTLNISVTEATSSNLGLINSLVIQEYSNTVPPTPSNLHAAADGKTVINLSWQDNSGNEDGFEIYRIDRSTGQGIVLATTAANVNFYSDTGLPENSTYDYRVRAFNDNGVSQYSNLAYATTLDYKVFVNISSTQDPLLPSPWNNTAQPPTSDISFNDFINEDGVPTTIGLTIDFFSNGGNNDSGNVTGDESGVYPDSAIFSYYYVSDVVPSEFRLTGLDSTYAYNLVFFNSDDGEFTAGSLNWDGRTAFRSGQQEVILDPELNIQNTVTLFDLRPNAAGDILFEVEAAPNAILGFWNVLEIHAYKAADEEDAIPVVYYAKTGTDITQLNNWSDTPDGLGSSPTSFNQPGIEYQILVNGNYDISNDMSITTNGAQLVAQGNATVNIDPSVATVEFNKIKVKNGVNLHFNVADQSQKDIVVSNEGVELEANSCLDIGNNRLVLNGTSGVNQSNSSGKLGSNHGELHFNVTGEMSSYLGFIPGRDTVNHVNLANTSSSEVFLVDSMFLTGSLKLSSGTFNSNDQLVLHSDANATGKIDKVEVGATLNGDVIFERYWERNGGGSYLLGVPVYNQVISDWYDDFTIIGTESNPGSWTSVSTWNADSASWTGLSLDASSLIPGQGLSAFVYNSDFVDGNVKLTNRGRPVIGSGDDGTMGSGEQFDFPLSFAGEGWNLLSNPYPSEINLNSIDWATQSSNLSSSVYVLDIQNFRYITWSSALPTDFYVAQGQGFWVQAVAANPTLYITEDDKTANNGTFYRTSDNREVLKILSYDNQGYFDEIYLVLMDGATNEYDYLLDAVDRKAGYVNLYSKIDESEDYSINAIPFLNAGESVVVDLLVDSYNKGINRMVFEEGEFDFDLYDYVLYDHHLDVSFDLVPNFEYEFDNTIIESSLPYHLSLIINEVESEPVTIIGNITDSHGNAVNAFDLSVISDDVLTVTTNSVGQYQFESSQGLTYEISEGENLMDLSKVTLLDALTLIKHLIGFRPLSSAYLQIASDLDNSENIDWKDFQLMRNILLRRIDYSDLEKSHEFIYSVAPNESGWWDIQSHIAFISDTMQGGSLDFTVSQKGDLYTNTNSSGKNSESLVDLLTIQKTVSQFETFSLPIELGVADNYEGVILNIEWENDLLKFKGINSEISGIQYEFNEMESELLVFWIDMNGEHDEQLKHLFDIDFEVIAQEGSNTTVTIGEGSYLIDNDFEVSNIRTSNFELAVDNTLGDQMDLIVYPNPFKRELNFEFSNSLERNATLTIYNNVGAVVFSKTFEKDDLRQFTWQPKGSINRGIYYYSVVSGEEVQLKGKLIYK